MLSGNYISIYPLIEGVYRDNDYSIQINISDAVEWIGEAMDLLYLKQSYINKVTGQDKLTPTIKIEDYRGELPCDYHELIQAREYCTQFPMRSTTDNFHKAQKDGRNYNFPINSDLTYTINDNYIFPSFETGEIELSYLAFPIDDKGFPKIPDNVSYIKAIKSYLVERIDFRLWRKNEISDKVYAKSEDDKAFYFKQADTRAKIFNFDKMESFKNSWLRLIPKINEHNAGFVYLGQQEERYIH